MFYFCVYGVDSNVVSILNCVSSGTIPCLGRYACSVS